MGLDVADDGTLGDGAEGKDVAYVESGLLTAVDELAGVHALGGDEELGVALVPVGVKELDLGDGRTTTGIMDDLLDDATDVAVLLGVVDGTELHGTLAGADVSLEDGGLTLTLGLLLFGHNNHKQVTIRSNRNVTIIYHCEIKEVQVQVVAGGQAHLIMHYPQKTRGIASWT
mmetsp:Transcript_21967/g.47881  ORF Transcript_21967/g.47881 Transcript_21967/m.47881 type:complete len:172 (-) Transcript_21967:235-750(-)